MSQGAYMSAAFETMPPSQDPQNPAAQNRLEPMLIRLPPALAAELRNLAKRTRVRQSDYLREAVADLLAKYGHLPADGSAM
jgi:Ribbon-helix-helix domain